MGEMNKVQVEVELSEREIAQIRRVAERDGVTFDEAANSLLHCILFDMRKRREETRKQ